MVNQIVLVGRIAEPIEIIKTEDGKKCSILLNITLADCLILNRFDFLKKYLAIPMSKYSPSNICSETKFICS